MEMEHLKAKQVLSSVEIGKLLISAELRSQIRSQRAQELQLDSRNTRGEKEQDNGSREGFSVSLLRLTALYRCRN